MIKHKQISYQIINHIHFCLLNDYPNRYGFKPHLNNNRVFYQLLEQLRKTLDSMHKD